jgi:hypothetical protein
MKNYRYIRTSLSFVNFVLFLIAFAFLFPLQNVSSVYGQEDPRCENNRRAIKDYKRQVGDLWVILRGEVYSARFRGVYEQLNQAAVNGNTLDLFRLKRQRQGWANLYNLEWHNQWDKDQPDFQIALRNKMGELLQKAKRYADLESVDRNLKNLEKRITEHETNLKALGCGKGTSGGCSNITGRWTNTVDRLGTSTWEITRDRNGYTATEGGLGGAKSKSVTLEGTTLRLEFVTGGIEGYYTWQLDGNCQRSTSGTLVWTRGMSGTRSSTLIRQ